MNKVLVLEFIDSLSRKFSLRVADPKADLTPEEVKDAMDAIIAANPFNRPALVAIQGAHIVTTTKQEIVFGA